MLTRNTTTRRVAAAGVMALAMSGFGAAAASAGGTGEPTGSDANKASAWEAYFSAQAGVEITCEKHEGDGSTLYGDDGDPATFVLPPPIEFSEWYAVVLKAGSAQSTDDPNHVIMADDLVIDMAYTHPSGKDISHVILCWGPDEDDDAKGDGETTTPGTETTSPGATGPVVETDIPSKDANAPWLLAGGALALIAGATAAGFGLRREAAKH